MARAESITFEEFRTRFSTEESCRAELFRLRFPNGFVCQKCGCTEYYPVCGRNTFQCRACRHQTSVTAETVMHRTHLPLTAWFWAIYLCATDKRGISAVQLSRTLNICYESAWYLLHRIRRAMAQRDENYALSGMLRWTTATWAEQRTTASVVAGRTRRRSWWRCQKRKTGLRCSRGCRSWKTSRAKHFSKSSAKLLRQVQKSNATATEAIRTCLAWSWTRNSMNLATCTGCTKPSAT